MSIRIIIAGDTVPTKSNEHLFMDGEALTLVGERCFNLLQSADYRIINLEVPLTERGEPIDKFGPNLVASPKAVKGLTKMSIDLVGLANNHVMDQGKIGLEDTIDILKRHGIAYTGAGENLKSAQRACYFELKGIVFGVYACAEHEFTIATDSYPGSNPFDPLYSLDHIAAMKEHCDYIIVMFHGGKEHYRFPSPELKRTCRRMVEKGADLVLVQHSHCIGSMEEYQGSTIVYGQGNFIFDGQDNEYWKTGLIVEINVKPDRKSSIVFHPIVKDEAGIKMAEGELRDSILADFSARSKDVLNDHKLEEYYHKFATELVSEYEFGFAGRFSGNIVFRVLNRLFKHKLASIFYIKKDKLRIIDYIGCEAHRELVLEGLKTDDQG